MAKLFGIIPYGASEGAIGSFVKDVGEVTTGFAKTALKTKYAEEARENALTDAVEQATLQAAINLDSQYPTFKAAEVNRYKKYEALRDNSAVGPEKAKFFYFSPGFLDKANWLETAIQWSSDPRNRDFKFTGSVSPEEEFQSNINRFKNTIKGKFGDTHGEYMSKLFIGQEEEPIVPSVPTTPTTPSVDMASDTGTTTAEQPAVTGTTDMTQATSGFYIPAKQQTVAQQKDRIWSTVLSASNQGVSPEQLVQAKIITPEELQIWYNTSGAGDLRLKAMEAVLAGNPDIVSGIMNQDPELVEKAKGNLAAMTNVYYNTVYAPILEQVGGSPQGGLSPVTINNKTYIPTGTQTPDTNEPVYGIQTDDGTEYFVYRNGVFLKATYENGKTIVEGDKNFNKKEFDKDNKNIFGIPSTGMPML